MNIQKEVRNILSKTWNAREETLYIPNVVLHIRDEILDIPDVVLDIRKEILDICNEIKDVPEPLTDIRKLLLYLLGQPQDIPTGFRGKQKLIFSGGNPMAYKRRSSQVIANAQQRATNLKAIDPNLDLGGGLTVTAFEDEIAEVQTTLEQYNTLLAQADAVLNKLNEQEKQLGTKSGRMLAGVGVRYGKDSSEYEMAGGTRTSEIKRGKKKEPEGV